MLTCVTLVHSFNLLYSIQLHELKAIIYPLSWPRALKSITIFTLANEDAMNIFVKSPHAQALDSLPRSRVAGTQNGITFFPK